MIQQNIKVPITPKIFLARNKCLYRTEQDSTIFFSFGWNLDFLWIFKVIFFPRTTEWSEDWG